MKRKQKACTSLFQLNQHHEICDDSPKNASEQVQRNGEEFCTGNCHCLLALLAYNLHEGFCFFRAIVPVTRVSGFHHRRALFSYKNLILLLGQGNEQCFHLFNQSISEYAEQKNLRQSIDQIANYSQSVNVHLFYLGGLIS